MQPINNLQQCKAEYSALETAVAFCSDETLKAQMSSRMQSLNEIINKLAVESIKPQHTASSGAALSTSSATAITSASATTVVAKNSFVSSDGSKPIDVQLSEADFKEFQLTAQKLGMEGHGMKVPYRDRYLYDFVAVQCPNCPTVYYQQSTYGTIKDAQRTFSYLLQLNQRTSGVSGKASKEALLKSNPEYCKLSEAWDKAGMPIADQIKRLEAYRAYAFGTDQWAKHFGQIIGDIPPLPADLDQILDCADPGEAEIPGKIGDTHILTLVPKTVLVDGKKIDLTLSNLAELINSRNIEYEFQNFYDFSQKRYEFHVDKCPPVLKDVKVEKSHWVLLRKEPFEERIMTDHYHQRQVNRIIDYRKLTNSPYQFPEAIDTAVSGLMYTARFGRPPFWKSIRCREVAEFPVVISFGCRYYAYMTFSQDSIGDNGTVGVAPARLL